MSTLTPESPDENEQQISIEASEISPYADTIHKFDASQDEFLDTVAELFSKPYNQSDSSVLNRTINNVVSHYKKCVETIHREDQDRESRIATIAQLTLEEEEKRISLFASIVPESGDSFVRYTRDIIKETLTNIYDDADNDQDAMMAILTTFTKGLASDMTHFLNFRPHIEQEVKEEVETHHLLRVIGKHALDVAKLGIGVTAALIAASYITKRR